LFDILTIEGSIGVCATRQLERSAEAMASRYRFIPALIEAAGLRGKTANGIKICAPRVYSASINATADAE
jgi:hypothetical protein